MGRRSECTDTAHFLPLLDLAKITNDLRAQHRARGSVNWLVGLLDWKSPQLPVQQRTRSFINPSRTATDGSLSD